MSIHGLDHVNIFTNDLEDTVAFYGGLLGLERRESSGAAMGINGAWMCEPGGRAIVHLVERGPRTQFAAGHEPGLPTAAVHHIAFQAQDFAKTLAHIEALGVTCRINDREHLGFRQINLVDPNNVNIELNFAGD